MDIKKFVAIDEKLISPVVEEHEEYYICHGEAVTPFRVAKSRCVVVDDEFAVIANMYSVTGAMAYARQKGYVKPYNRMDFKLEVYHVI